jgi:hypothetical protein
MYDHTLYVRLEKCLLHMYKAHEHEMLLLVYSVLSVIAVMLPVPCTLTFMFVITVRHTCP